MSDSRQLDEYVARRGLCMVPDPAKGHRTVATRRFVRGQTVLSINPLYGFPVRPTEESPATHADGNDQSPSRPLRGESVDPLTRCVHCFHPLPARYPRCSRCRQAAQYCSPACLTAHWNARHHFECGHLDTEAVDEAAAKLKPEYRPYLRMAAGVGAALVSAKRKQNGKPGWLQIQAAAWDRLVGHRDMHPQYVLRQYKQIASVLVAHVKGTGTLGYVADPSISDADDARTDAVVSALCRFGCNNFAAYDYSAHAVTGHLCSPLASLLFNHSCYPNASFVYSNGLQVVRALREIREGEEVTLAYVDGMHPRSVRRKTLADVYFFGCTCTRCEGASERGKVDSLLDGAVDNDTTDTRQTQQPPLLLPSNLPTNYTDHKPRIDPWVIRVIRGLFCLVNNGTTTTDDDASSFRKLDTTILDAVKEGPPQNIRFFAYKHWLECQDEYLDKVSEGHSELWPWACVSSLYVLAFYVMAYPPYHPLVGTQCLEAAKLVWNSMQVSDTPPVAAVDGSLVKCLVLAAKSVLEVAANLPTVSSSSDSTLLTRQIALLLEQLSAGGDSSR
ncbi:hypothetical protein EV177_000149 [Coemansia sp. RSA 1804]|nr:hypothetical protein EV177_000149 [Coemansia sp. RSA 1804]